MAVNNEDAINRFGLVFKSKKTLAQVIGLKRISRASDFLSESDLRLRLSKSEESPLGEEATRIRLMNNYAEYCQDNPQDVVSQALYRYSTRSNKQGA